MGIKLNNLTVVGTDSFATDTLANIEQLQLNLNLMTDACNNLRIAGDLGDEDAIKLIVKYCN